jgi:predicted glycosyltransferase
LRQRRRDTLLAAFALARPEAVVIEGFPFARRAFRFELDPLIAAARESRAGVICSVRDIIVRRDDPDRIAATVARVREDFDAVLVHGDPTLVPFDASFPAAPQIAERLIYTGYIAPPRAHPPVVERASQVIVSAGGGAAGQTLFAAALAARRAGCLAHLSWLFVTGANFPDAAFVTLRHDAPAGVTIARFAPDLAALLGQCRVSVSQAGYNTVLEIVAARARAVLVPFAAERETEQLLRAERLAELGAAELLGEDELSPRTLAAAIERAAASEPAPVAIDTGGAARSARIIGEILRNRSRTGPFTAATLAGMMAR